MKTNTHDIAEMLDGEAEFWIAGGAYDMAEQCETKEKVCNALKERCLDLEDFEFGYFMDCMVVRKRRRILM
jgi:hypothetical protein